MGHKVSVNVASAWRAAQVIVLLVCMGANSGCYYYKSAGYDHVASRQKKFCKALRSSLNDYKYVIVHQGNNAWHLDNMILDLPDKKHCPANFNVMYGSLEEVDSLCAFYDNKYRAGNRRALRYFARDEDYVVSQVHVYVGENSFLRTDSLSIPFSSINRIEVYNQAAGRTFWTWAAVKILIDIVLSPHSSPKHEPKAGHGPRRR